MTRGRAHALSGTLAPSFLVLLAACGALTPMPTSPAEAPRQLAEPPQSISVEPAVAATPWVEGTEALPPGWDASASHESLDDLLDSLGSAIAAELAPNTNAGLDADIIGDPARGDVGVVVAESGAMDDSVHGLQLYLHVLEDAGRWSVDSVWHRTLCRRGASGDLCV